MKKPMFDTRSLVAKGLKDRGFKKSGQNWTRQRSVGVQDLVHIIRSRFSLECFIEIGLSLSCVDHTEFGKRDAVCWDINGRTSSVCPEVEGLLDDDYPLSDKDRADGIDQLLSCMEGLFWGNFTSEDEVIAFASNEPNGPLRVGPSLRKHLHAG